MGKDIAATKETAENLEPPGLSRSLRLAARGITYFQFSLGCAPINLSGCARI
jgi:hypothetical protein